MFVTMLAMMFTGQRVFGAIGFVSAGAALLLWGDGAIEMPYMAAWKLFKWYPMLTLPLFIYMGFMISESGIANDLYKMFHVYFGGVRGGLNPYDLKRLYYTLLRPKIEFGLTHLPYKKEIIKTPMKNVIEDYETTDDNMNHFGENETDNCDTGVFMEKITEQFNIDFDMPEEDPEEHKNAKKTKKQTKKIQF